MWLFTARGFYSAVQDIDDHFVVIRARMKQDLFRLRPLLAVTASCIHSTPDRDYPYRITVTREAFAALLAKLGREIDYTNFKEHVEKVFGRSRSNLYAHVWASMMELERLHRAPQKEGGPCLNAGRSNSSTR